MTLGVFVRLFDSLSHVEFFVSQVEFSVVYSSSYRLGIAFSALENITFKAKITSPVSCAIIGIPFFNNKKVQKIIDTASDFGCYEALSGEGSQCVDRLTDNKID